jgi:CheY-like chemotaxis protein/uncharacterized protein YodC (DUF2158 family)
MATEPLRILVADDNRDAAETLVLVLEMLGHAAHAVYGGQEAVDAAASESFDLAILDLAMPGVDGYAAARLIKSMHPGLTLIALSGHIQAQHRLRTSQEGFSYHLAKPLDTDLLMDILEELRAARNAPRTRGSPLEVGALVQLREGGAVMSIKGISADLAYCYWYDEHRLREGTFLLGRLVRADAQRRSWANAPVPLVESGPDQ